jgi:hypothetical protein
MGSRPFRGRDYSELPAPHRAKVYLLISVLLLRLVDNGMLKESDVVVR